MGGYCSIAGTQYDSIRSKLLTIKLIKNTCHYLVKDRQFKTSAIENSSSISQMPVTKKIE